MKASPMLPYRKLFFVTACLFLVFFRPILALKLHQSFDEVCYMEWLYPFVGKTVPSCYSQSHLSGVVALWLPFAQLGKWAAQLLNEPSMSWVEYFVGLSSYLYYAASLFLIAEILRNKKSDLNPILFFLTVPILHFATQDTFLVHSVEFFLSCLVLYLLTLEKHLHALVFAFLLSITRINDAPVLFVVLAASLKGNRNLLLWVLGSVLTGITLWLCYDIGFIRGYNQTWFWPLVRSATQEKIGRLLFAADWGLLWLSPLWLFVLVVGATNFRRLSAPALAALFWMFVELCVVAVWRGNGRYFGHRYLIGSFAASLWVWLELSDTIGIKKIGKLLALYSATYHLILQAIFPTLWPWPVVDNFKERYLPFYSVFQTVIQGNFFSLFIESPLGMIWFNNPSSYQDFTNGQIFFLLFLFYSILVGIILCLWPKRIIRGYPHRVLHQNGAKTFKPRPIRPLE